MIPFIVMAGLDPAIHDPRRALALEAVDARVKLGHDGRVRLRTW